MQNNGKLLKSSVFSNMWCLTALIQHQVLIYQQASIDELKY